MSEETQMNYFGTNLESHGHFFWTLDGDKIFNRNLNFQNYPFDPEELFRIGEYKKGDVAFGYIKDYTFLAICGSPVDQRPETNSVFITKEILTRQEMVDKVLSIPVAKKIIDQMPFEVNLKEQE